MDDPNEYEKAIEEYAEAVRNQRATAIAREQARHLHESYILTRQECWRKVREYISQGKIHPGIYRLNGPHHAEGVVIGAEDYPDILPMFRK